MALRTQQLPEAQITGELCRLFREQGYHRNEIDGEPYIIGPKIRNGSGLVKAE